MATISSPLVWLITGTSCVVRPEVALVFCLTIILGIQVRHRTLPSHRCTQSGDKVIATARARSLAQLDDLKNLGAATLELDVTAPLLDLHATAAKAVEIYGKIDVIVNNAGM